MFYGIIHEELFNKNKSNNGYSKDLNTDNERENIKNNMQRLKDLNDKYKAAAKPREY